jgi:Yip1 domain
VGRFAYLREDTDRSETVAVLAFCAGVAASLALGGDEVRELDGVDAAIWLFVTGLCLGFVVYWLGGWALAFVVPRLGGGRQKRRTRHVLAYSFLPLAFAFPLWLIWPRLLLLPAAASLALLVLGLREVEGWSTARAAAAVVLAAVWLATLVVCVLSVLGILHGAFE